MEGGGAVRANCLSVRPTSVRPSSSSSANFLRRTRRIWRSRPRRSGSWPRGTGPRFMPHFAGLPRRTLRRWPRSLWVGHRERQTADMGAAGSTVTTSWTEQFGAPRWPRSMSALVYPFLAALEHVELDAIALPSMRGESIEVRVDTSVALQQLRVAVGAAEVAHAQAAAGARCLARRIIDHNPRSTCKAAASSGGQAA